MKAVFNVKCANGGRMLQPLAGGSRRVAALVIACIGLSATTHARERTQAVPLEVAAREADLIVLGYLARSVPCRSQDERTVYTIIGTRVTPHVLQDAECPFSTDYELQIDEFLKAKEGTTILTWTSLASLLIRHSAGEVPSDGALVNALPVAEAVLTPGRTLLAFLTYDKAIQRYRITRDFVFEIAGDQRLKTLASGGVDPRMNGKPLREVILELQRLLAAAEVSRERNRQLLNCRRRDAVDRTPIPVHRRAMLRAALADRIPAGLAATEPGWTGPVSFPDPSRQEWVRELTWAQGEYRLHVRWQIATDVESAHRGFHNVLGLLSACPREAFDDIGDEAVACSSTVLYFRYRNLYGHVHTLASEPTLTRRIATQIVEAIKAVLETP